MTELCTHCKNKLSDGRYVKEASCSDTNNKYCSLRCLRQHTAYDRLVKDVRAVGTDPKKVAGDKKIPMDLLPAEALRQCALALQTGAEKYGVYNWRHGDGVEAMTYAAALIRHVLAFVDGEDEDPESGLDPLAHVMATCSLLIDAKKVGKLIDNRPVLGEYDG